MDGSIPRHGRRAVFLAISISVYLVDLFTRFLRSLLGKPIPSTAVVLYYHSIPGDKRAAFAKQMDQLVRTAKPIPANMSLSIPSGEHFVALTFDDGYQNNVDNAVPELLRRGIPATLFVVAEAIGRTPNWGAYVDALDTEEPIMTAEQIRRLPCGLLQVGSHTLTHPMLTKLSEQEARRELAESRRRLSEISRSDVKLFCFPYGAFDDKLVAWCREEGYERVFTTQPHLASPNSDDFVVGRVIAEPDDWALEYRLKLYGAYRWLPFAFSLKRKIFRKSEHN